MPKKKIADEALDAGPTEQVADESLADEAAEVAEVEPEEFDVVEWLSGIGPLRVGYPIGDGRYIQMQSRTPDFLKELAQSDDWPKEASDDERDRAFLAAHVISDIRPDMLEGLQKHRPMDFQEMVDLAIAIDSKPANQIHPRFLRGASD